MKLTVKTRSWRITEPNRKPNRLVYEPKTENSFWFCLHVLGINQGVVKERRISQHITLHFLEIEQLTTTAARRIFH